MAESFRTRILRHPKREHEVRVITNPSDSSSLTAHLSRSSKSRYASQPPINQHQRLLRDDYEAPLTSHSLSPDSRWLIVRRNLHRIRFMGHNARKADNTLPDFYIGLQMKRELKRAQDEIKNIHKEKNFRVVKRFDLAVDEKRIKSYDTSHVKPDDALTYDRLGEEPLALQNLLFYFSKQDVSHGSLFWDFLNEVNHVLDLKRRRTVRVERLRRLAFILAIILYCIVGIMLFLLIISVITTATKMNDPEVKWVEHKVDKYSSTVLSLS